MARHPNDTGLSIFSFVAQIMKVGLGPSNSLLLPVTLGIHFFFSAAIFLTAYAVSERLARPQRFDLFCCWLFLSALLISPRIFDYDLAVISIPFVLLARMLLMKRGLGLGVAVTVAVFGLILLRTPSYFQIPLSEWSASFVIIGVWFGAAVEWLTVDSDGDLPHVSHGIPN
jgi:uncharacterized membrane protein